MQLLCGFNDTASNLVLLPAVSLGFSCICNRKHSVWDKQRVYQQFLKLLNTEKEHSCPYTDPLFSNHISVIRLFQ